VTVEQLLDHLDGMRPTGNGSWIARCPAHDDRNPSLSVALGDDGRVLLKCHAGCTTEEIVASIGLTMADLFAERPDRDGMREIVATYDYVDEDGTLLFQVVRFAPKDFRQRRPNGNGGWDWRLGDVRRVLYRLPQVLETARAGGKVAVVEGEKDVHALEAHGAIATCNPGGAGKWRQEYAESLRGAEVAVIADDDEVGRKHAREVARSLDGIAAAVEVLKPVVGKDIADHLATGRRLDELVGITSHESQGDQVAPTTAELLDALATTIRRYVVVSEAQRDAEALWTLHAHAIEAADSTPYLSITSAEKQSGKSRNLEVLAQLVPRPMEAANVSDAALFRALGSEDGPMTLLFDEIDSIFGRNVAKTREEQRGLLNAGWRRGAVAWRCEGEGSKQTPVSFPVFGAKALAGIGELPETLADRSIPIRLRRRRPDEKVERGRYRAIVAACEPLRLAAIRWTGEHVDTLRDAEPELPEELSDRAQDGAEPLLAIADLAGGEWPQRARRALVGLHRDKPEESESQGVRLLADIRAAFDGKDRITTVELLTALKADDEAPWDEWGRSGAGLMPRALSRLLAPYGIRPGDLRTPDGTKKGYKREQFEDAWQRYLPSDPPPKRDKRDIGSSKPKSGGFESATERGSSRIENDLNPHRNGDVADVADGSWDGEPQAATETEEAEAKRLERKFGLDIGDSR
jgi:hypothetical protein